MGKDLFDNSPKRARSLKNLMRRLMFPFRSCALKDRRRYATDGEYAARDFQRFRAAFRSMEAEGSAAGFVAGHSLGEYSVFTAAR